MEVEGKELNREGTGQVSEEDSESKEVCTGVYAKGKITKSRVKEKSGNEKI